MLGICLGLLAAAPGHAQGEGSPRDSVQNRPAADTTAPPRTLPAFQVKMTGRIQTLYQYSAAHDGVAPAATPSPAGGDTSLFKVHRARLGFTGWVHDPRIEFELQADLAGSSAFLRRAYANYRVRGQAAQLRAGRFIIPFGRQQTMPLFQQATVDRVALADEFGRGHDDGAMVWGLPAAGRVEYYAGVFNGDGFNRNTQQDGSNLWAGRLVWSPLGRMPAGASAWGDTRRPRVSMGASASRNGGWLHEVNGEAGMQAPTRTCTDGACVEDGGDQGTVRSWGLDAALHWRGTAWMAERFGRVVDPRSPSLADLRASGWYAQGGAFVLPKRLEIGGRIARYSPRDDTRIGRTTELTPFASLFLRGNDVKLIADWTRHERATDDQTVTARRSRVSLLFTF